MKVLVTGFASLSMYLFISALASEIDLSSPLNYGTPGSQSVLGTPASGATPIRQRPDVRSDRKLRQVAIGGSDPPSVSFYINLYLNLHLENYL